MRVARIVGIGLLLLLGVVASVTTALRGLALGLDFRGGARFVYEVQVPDGVDAQEVTSRARDVIASRLDAMRVPEASVVARASSVSVELAGLDAEQFEGLRAVIGRTALLELVAVDDVWQVPESVPPGVEVETAGLMEGTDRFLVARGPGARERLRVALEGFTAPEGRRLAVGSDARGAWRSYVLIQEGALRGSIRDAEVVVDEQTGSPGVAVEYDDEGRERLAELTRRQRDRRIAIVLDGEVLSAPVVREPIAGGRASIHLGADRTYAAALAEANALVTALRAGALPAPILLESASLISPAIAPATRLYAAVVALGAYLALAVVFALRYRAAGALWLVLGTPIAIVTALAITSMVGATVSATYCAGVALAVVWMMSSVAFHLEVARRGQHAWIGWLAMLGAYALSLTIAIALFSLSAGPMRGFAVGQLLAWPAGVLVTALGAISMTGQVRRIATAAACALLVGALGAPPWAHAQASVRWSFSDGVALERAGWRAVAVGGEPAPALRDIATRDGVTISARDVRLELAAERVTSGPWARASAGYELEARFDVLGECAGEVGFVLDDGVHRPSVRIARTMLTVSPSLVGTGIPNYNLQAGIAAGDSRVVVIALAGDTLRVRVDGRDAGSLELPHDVIGDVGASPDEVGRRLGRRRQRGRVMVFAQNCVARVRTIDVTLASAADVRPELDAAELVRLIGAQLPTPWREQVAALAPARAAGQCVLTAAIDRATRTLLPRVGPRIGLRTSALAGLERLGSRRAIEAAIAAFPRPTRRMQFAPRAPAPERPRPIADCPDGVDDRGRPCCHCQPRPPETTWIEGPAIADCRCRTRGCGECVARAGLVCSARESGACTEATRRDGTTAMTYELSRDESWPEADLVGHVWTALRSARETSASAANARDAVTSAAAALALAVEHRLPGADAALTALVRDLRACR